MMRFSCSLAGGQFQGGPDPEKYGDILILWRGYIGNPEKVRSEALLKGIKVEHPSTGELFALAYRLWEKGLNQHLTGEYGIAVFDTVKRELFLSHDLFGLVPVFYGRRSGICFAASHLEEIIAHAGTGELDEEFIADYVANPSYPSGRTAYKGISRLAPGTSVILTSEREEKFRAPLPNILGPGTERDYIDRFLTLFDEGVSAAIPGDGNIWCELSGGFDSSSVFALVHRHAPERLGAFSIVYELYGQADERKWMRAVLDRYPVPEHTLDGDNALPYSELPDRFCPEPGLYLLDWAGRQRYEKMAAENDVKVVLTGQGGDLVFFGMGPVPYYCADLARTSSFLKLTRELKTWKTGDRHRRSYLFYFMHYVMHPLMAHYRRHPVLPAWHRSTSPFIDPEYAKKWSLDERCKGKPQSMKSVEHSWFMEQLSVISGQIAQINQIPRTFEFRHPVLYRPLVEFMMSLPQNLKFTPATDRLLQREAMKDILPDEIRLRTVKTIYDQPAYEGLRQGKDFITALTNDPLIAQNGIVDPVKWKEAVSQARLGRTHYLPQFEAAASLEIWLRQLS